MIGSQAPSSRTTNSERLHDGQGGTVKTLRISGINVQVVNGLDATNGFPTAPNSTNVNLTQVNGMGNLIVDVFTIGHRERR